MELNKTYTGGVNEDGTKRFQEISLIMSTDSEQYSGIWNNMKNITILGTDNYPRTTISTYDVLCNYNKSTPQRQVHAPPASVTFVQHCDTENNKIVPGNNDR